MAHGMLLYGAGLRLKECLRLRVQEIEFSRNEILVRNGKGKKDRVTMLPGVVKEPLAVHFERVRRQHDADLQAGFGRVQLPDALARKYPNAEREWGWQWVFPAGRICRDPRFGAPQRYHIHESVLQKAIHAAARAAASANPLGPTLCAIMPSAGLCRVGLGVCVFRLVFQGVRAIDVGSARHKSEALEKGGGGRPGGSGRVDRLSVRFWRARSLSARGRRSDTFALSRPIRGPARVRSRSDRLRAGGCSLPRYGVARVVKHAFA